MDKSILYRYTVKEDIANAISHGIGVILAFFGLTYLCYLSDTLDQYVVALVYGTALLLMFLFSTLYHSIFNDMTRSIFKRLDHCSIFLLITATYTPYTFLVIKTPLSYFIYGLLVVLTIIGIILKVFYVGKFKRISTLIYVLMGWVVIFQVKPLVENTDIKVLVFLALGGIVYTVGAIFYAFAKFKYHHFLWHGFVLVAAILQYISILYLYQNL